ncbi:MAG: hypothetical protein ACRCUE_10325 [Bosea sp. (in: a-proteobacteria)]
MFGFLRNAAVIGTIAYCSPVHDTSPDQKLDALRAVPAMLMGEALKSGPGLVQQAAGHMDVASRSALSAKIIELAMQPGQNAKATNGR